MEKDKQATDDFVAAGWSLAFLNNRRVISKSVSIKVVTSAANTRLKYETKKSLALQWYD